MSRTISIYDTTLRDGTQGEGVSLTVEDKIKIAKKLDALGVHYIEGGIPGGNVKDAEFFRRARDLNLRAKLVAFGSTRRKNSVCEQDANLLGLLNSGAKAAALVGKSWDFHVHTALQTTLEENLAMIRESVAFLKGRGLEVIFDAEHFFDGFKNNSEYALAVLKAAQDAGADWIVLCDTNGGALPGEISEIIARTLQEIRTPVGIHTHNDGELAVANTLAGVAAGARQVQGTINGYGERCGNANLCSIIPNLQLKMGYHCVSDDQLAMLSSVARYVAEVANMHMPNNQPYVGVSAFAHKGGIHASAILRDPKTYEHIPPEQVGNQRRVLVSELAGHSNILSKAQEMGLDIRDESTSRRLIERVKELEHQGYQFEGADASLELLLRDACGEDVRIFKVISFKIIVEKTEKGLVSEAIVKIDVDGREAYTVAEGNGPVNALDNALRKALVQHFPDIRNVHLTDYKVRVLDEQNATASKVRVLIESSDFKEKWSTVGVSANVIEASWEALVDSIRYALIGKEKNRRIVEAEPVNGLSNH